ncbi:Hypothetical predicted protein [Pelobates cultripes]|uniref:Uncharacterized protein n=1 Tax=Pelobates cultripes TaxID=61616 RepID=A0AAD1RS04_PELCU|nr:Hypothetical predicted protein [Pelobates cultripes]
MASYLFSKRRYHKLSAQVSQKPHSYRRCMAQHHHYLTQLHRALPIAASRVINCRAMTARTNRVQHPVNWEITGLLTGTARLLYTSTYCPMCNGAAGVAVLYEENKERYLPRIALRAVTVRSSSTEIQH